MWVLVERSDGAQPRDPTYDPTRAGVMGRCSLVMDWSMIVVYRFFLVDWDTFKLGIAASHPSTPATIPDLAATLPVLGL